MACEEVGTAYYFLIFSARSVRTLAVQRKLNGIHNLLQDLSLSVEVVDMHISSLEQGERHSIIVSLSSSIYRSDALSCRQMRDCRRWIRFDGSFKQTSTDSLPCSPSFSQQNWANWPAKSMKSHRHENARQYGRPTLLSHKEEDLKIYHFTSICCSNSGIFIVFVKNSICFYESLHSFQSGE